MATLEHTVNVVERPQTTSYPAGSLRFDLLSLLLSTWFLIGLFIDGWAHNHGEVDNTFFTPWHALLYSGVLAVGAFLGLNQFRNVLKGYAFTRALPRGYLLSLVGVAIFFVGGGFDFVWHSLFGFEANVEALLSPAHLLLASGAFLFVTGPLRAAWNRRDARGWSGLYTVVYSLVILLSLLTFFTQFANIYPAAATIAATHPERGDVFFWDVTDLSAVLISGALTVGMILFSIRRWTLPFGALTVLLTANALLMYWLRIQFVSDFWPALLAAPLAGLAGDVLLRAWQPSAERVGTLRLFAFLLPVILFASYFLLLIATSGIWWTIHMWLGVTAMAGVGGLFLSYLAVPPAVPVE